MTLETLAAGLAFPEAPRWHDGRLWLSDMQGGAVLRIEGDGTVTTVVEVPEGPSGLGFLPDGRLLVASQHDRRVLRLDPDGLDVHADLSGLATWHLNDMVVDARGRAYVGNYGSGAPPGEPIAPAVLALVEPDGSARVVAEDLLFPNGAAITPDGRTLIVAETRAEPARLTTFAIAADGGLSDRRTLLELPGEFPDGIALDAEGAVWVASPFSATIFRVTSDGAIERRLEVANPYAVALGGADGRDLFVCTSGTWIPEDAARERSGAVHRVRVDVPAA